MYRIAGLVQITKTAPWKRQACYKRLYQILAIAAVMRVAHALRSIMYHLDGEINVPLSESGKYQAVTMFRLSMEA